MNSDRTTLRLALLPGLLAALLVGACGGDEADGPAMVVRDSAGIRIVANDHTQPAWTQKTAWRLSNAPVVTIGSMDGSDGDLLHAVTDARILPDGRIAVVNSGSHQVLIFDPHGDPLAQLGREGEGPGEFKHAMAVFPGPGDSLLVFQFGKASVFGPDLAYARQFEPQPPSEIDVVPGSEPLDQFDDGSLLYRIYHLQNRERRGLGRSRVRMARGFPDGSVESIGDFDDQTGFFGPGNRQYFFGPWAWEAASDSTMWYGPGDVLEFREVRFDGSVRSLVRLDRPLRPVTESDVKAHAIARRDRLRGTPQGTILQKQFDDVSHPDSFPAHFLMEVDDGGNLWVQDYRPWASEDHIDRIWSVFDPDGRYLGDVTVPGGLRVFTIHADRLVGVHTDELGVERIHIYAIEKPE